MTTENTTQKYFELHVRDLDTNRFYIDFGDFDREVVEQEIEDRIGDMLYGSNLTTSTNDRESRRSDYKIVVTDEKLAVLKDIENEAPTIKIKDSCEGAQNESISWHSMNCIIRDEEKIIQEDEDTLTAFAVKIVSGSEFSKRSGIASHNSMHSGYEPPIRYEVYARVLEAFAKLSSFGSVYAHAVHNSGLSFSLYGKKSTIASNVWDALSNAVASGYTDVIGRSSPDGGNHPSNVWERPYTLTELLVMYAWAEWANNGSLGWVVAGLIKREQIADYLLPDFK